MSLENEAVVVAERRDLLQAWAQRCRLAGVDASVCSSAEAEYLVTALSEAVGADPNLRQLGRAARGWGSLFQAPVDVLTCLSALREVVVDSQGAPSGGWHEDWLPIAAEAFNGVSDHLMREAVDAASANLRAEARTDALTGSANRLALAEELPRAVTSARRSGLDLAVAMIDLDGLKAINDNQGHEAGDLALVALSATLHGVLRGSDTLYRMGGDEFVVLMPFTDAPGAETMLTRAASLNGPSFSWGVASVGMVGAVAFDRPEILISTADAALYAGRAERRAAPATAPIFAAAIVTARHWLAGRLTAARDWKMPAPAIPAALVLGVLALIGIVIPLTLSSTPRSVPAATGRSVGGRAAPSTTLPKATRPSLPGASRSAPGGSTVRPPGATEKPSAAKKSGGTTTAGVSSKTASSAGASKTSTTAKVSRPAGGGSKPAAPPHTSRHRSGGSTKSTPPAGSTGIVTVAVPSKSKPIVNVTLTASPGSPLPSVGVSGTSSAIADTSPIVSNGAASAPKTPSIGATPARSTSPTGTVRHAASHLPAAPFRSTWTRGYHPAATKTHGVLLAGLERRPATPAASHRRTGVFERPSGAPQRVMTHDSRARFGRGARAWSGQQRSAGRWQHGRGRW